MGREIKRVPIDFDAPLEAGDGRTEPPDGEGWQLWQTVSDGPISPVFETAAELIEWMTTPAAKWGAMGPWSREAAAAFVNGPGWAPTLIWSGATGVVDGVTAMAALACES